MEIEISLPAGTHTLTVKVTDVDGNDTIYDEEIYSENGEDKVNPEIKTTVDQATKEIVITATDETELDYVTYRWNDEEEQRQDADSENPKQIKFNIEIPKGTNDLTIIAVDKNNNSTTKTDKYTGVTKPEIKVTVSEDKKSVHVDCYHENGLSEISVRINDGETRNVDGLSAENPRTEAGFDFGLEGEKNTVIIKARSVDGTETEVTEEITSEAPPVEEDNIEINFEEPENSEQNAKLTIKSSSGISGGTVVINDQTFELPREIYGLKETPSIDLPLAEGTTKVTVTVKTESGAEKTEEKEFTR